MGIASSYNCEWVGVTAFTGSVNRQPFNRVILELMVKLFNALQVIFTVLEVGGGGDIPTVLVKQDISDSKLNLVLVWGPLNYLFTCHK